MTVHFAADGCGRRGKKAGYLSRQDLIFDSAYNAVRAWRSVSRGIGLADLACTLVEVFRRREARCCAENYTRLSSVLRASKGVLVVEGTIWYTSVGSSHLHGHFAALCKGIHHILSGASRISPFQITLTTKGKCQGQITHLNASQTTSKGTVLHIWHLCNPVHRIGPLAQVSSEQLGRTAAYVGVEARRNRREEHCGAAPEQGTDTGERMRTWLLQNTNLLQSTLADIGSQQRQEKSPPFLHRIAELPESMSEHTCVEKVLQAIEGIPRFFVQC